MSEALRVLNETKRIQKNSFANGKVASFDTETKQVVVSIEFNDVVLDSQPLPLVGRNSIRVDEPVLVILPTANPSVGYVLALLPDPELMRLSERVSQLEQKITSLITTMETHTHVE